MSKSIELVVNFDTEEKKTFYQPTHIKGSASLEALELGKEMQKKGDDVDSSDFERIADFIAEKLYNNKFTRDELIDGVDATNLFSALTEQLQSVFGEDSGKSSPEKKA